MVTIFYVIGGYHTNYDNLYRSLDSLKKCEYVGKVFILEVGNKLKSTQQYQVYNEPNLISLDGKIKTGYLFWRLKYAMALRIDTEYGVYFDSDVVMVNNNLEELIEECQDKIGVCEHFYVPTINDFEKKVVPKWNIDEFNKFKNKLCLKDSYPFFSGGVFLFKNSINNQGIFKETLNNYNWIYQEGSDYIKGITDELVFSGVLNTRKDSFKILSGALNHCCMGDEYMPVKYENDVLYGKNFKDKDWKEITVFHCDLSRRDPGAAYQDPIKTKIRACFNV
jgi:hypothetical protein